MARQNLIKTKCATCGKALERRPDMIRPRSFCNNNRECINAYNRGGIFLNKEFKDEVVKLRKEGWKLREVAEYLLVNINTIWGVENGK